MSKNLFELKYKTILFLSFPVMISMVMHSVLMFSDRFFISKLGVDEAAGAALSSTLVWVMISFTGIVSVGTVSLISRAIGKKDHNEASKGGEQSIIISTIISVFISIVAMIINNSLFNFFDATDIVTNLGKSYFSIILWGYPAMFVGIVTSSIFHAVGNTKTPMIIYSGLCLLNALLDPIFIYGIGIMPSYGIEGAALASVISQYLALFATFFYLYRDKPVKLPKVLEYRLQYSMVKRLFNIGIWAGLNSFSRPVSAIVLQKIVAYHGTKSLAAFSFGLQWVSILFIFGEGIRVAISTLIGQYLGAKKYKETDKIITMGIYISILLLLVPATLIYFFAEYGISIFSDDLEVIKIGASYLKITMITFILGPIMMTYIGVFMGSGDTKPAMIISFISNWGGKIVFAWWGTYILKLGVDSVFIGIALSIIIESTGLWLWGRGDKWKYKTV